MRATHLALLLGALLAAGAARATPGAAPPIRYRGGGEGRVVFDGRLHAAKGFSCRDCHDTLFATRKRGLISAADHRDGKACFACHDGERAFADCAGCHRP